MRIEKITPVERVWGTKDSKSKRPKREELVPEDKKGKGKKEENNQEKRRERNLDRVEITGRTPISTMEEEARRIYEIMRKRDIEERRKRAEREEQEER